MKYIRTRDLKISIYLRRFHGRNISFVSTKSSHPVTSPHGGSLAAICQPQLTNMYYATGGQDT